MVFSSTVFLFLFLPLVIMIYYNPFFKGRRFRNASLLLASLAFYAWGEPLFVLLMLFSIFVGWMAGACIENADSPYLRKVVLILSVAYNLVVLFVFKYLTFLAKEFGWLVGSDFSLIYIALPIGISFFTFQLLSYLFDVYYEKANAQKNILDLALYIALFPQLIAGPIVRYDAIEGQIKNRQESVQDFCEGMTRFILGLAKKVLVANYVGQVADAIFDDMEQLSVATAWLGSVAYTLQIYYDFSGYSDMAIGLGKMFGFRFPENFNYPYIASSITDFWRRWHISLSSWFRDYVYIPLGGNHVDRLRWIFNLLIVWALTGIWHGANWTFLCWGLFYFVLLMLEKTTGFVKRLGGLTHVYTVICIIIGWTIFRSESLLKALEFIGYMFGIGTIGFFDDVSVQYVRGSYIVYIIALMFAVPAEFWCRSKRINEIVKPMFILIVFLLSIIKVVEGSYNPFIYFNF